MDINEQEIWKPLPLPEYSEAYEVSNLGRIRRSIDGRGRARAGRIMAGNKPPKNDYEMTMICWNGKQIPVLIHRMVAWAFLGPQPVGLEINHKDGDKHNNRADNLEYCTHTDNMRHAVENGLKHGVSRSKKQELLHLYSSEIYTRQELALRFNVHPSTVYAITRYADGGFLRHSRLTNDNIQFIREVYKNKAHPKYKTIYELADMFNIDPSYVSRVARGVR